MHESPFCARMAELMRQHGSPDIAIAEMRRLMADDRELRDDYSEWCAAAGVSERRGLAEFCDEYFREHNSKYDSLSDYDD